MSVNVRIPTILRTYTSGESTVQAEGDSLGGVLDALDAGVLAQPGWFYDFAEEAWVVLSLLTPEDVFAEGAARIAALARG